MSLNVKDPQAHKLAQLLASETGETMTAAVTQALRERLDRVRRRRKGEATAMELLAIGRRCAKHLRGPVENHAALLYNKQGLPK